MKVLAFGTFDIFHPGHEHYLQEAKKLGDELYVVLARDETVKKVKGKAPHNNEEARLEKVRSLSYVHFATLGNPGDKYQIIEQIRPDIIAIGYDQISFVEGLAEKLAERGLYPKIVKFTKGYEPDKYKSSKMRPNQ
jgi:FAD synthetase